MKIAVLLNVAALLIVQGCVQSRPLEIDRFAKQGTSYDDFLKDRYACIKDARSNLLSAYIESGSGAARSGEILRSDIYHACMAAHGYREDPSGFAPPADGVVRMR
jgi:hypothetical protein